MCLMTGRLLVDGEGEPLRAAEVLLQASRRAFTAGPLSPAELLLREAGRAAAGSEDHSAEIACQLTRRSTSLRQVRTLRSLRMTACLVFWGAITWPP